MKSLLTLLSFILITHAYGREKWVAGEIIVRLKKDVKASEFFSNKNLRVSHARDIKLRYATLHVTTFDEKSIDMMEVVEELRQNSAVEIAEPNYIYSIDRPLESKDFKSTPTDPLFNKLWGLHNTGNNDPSGKEGIAGTDINALKAWEITKGRKDIVVAVIDTGIDFEHPDLKENMWTNKAEFGGKPGVDDDGNGLIDDIYGFDFANGDASPMDDHNHGTHCAGTIGAVHNDIGVSGVMANVRLMAIKFLTAEGSGSLEGAVKAINYAASFGADVLSNSWGGPTSSDHLYEAFKEASNEGIVIVAAAGNSATNNDVRPQYPANYAVEGMISVGAMTAQNTPANFTCYGKKTVHISAPGHHILSTVRNGEYKSYSGTSMATPHVAGVIGLLLSHKGRLSHSDLKDQLMYTSIPVASLRSKNIPGGRIDAFNLLTGVRPDRSIPERGKWVKVAVDLFSTQHPYRNFVELEQTYTVEGAKFVRAYLPKFHIEPKFDQLEILNKDGSVIEKLDGEDEDYVTEYIKGDTIGFRFKSDHSRSYWGFSIDTLEVQYKEDMK